MALLFLSYPSLSLQPSLWHKEALWAGRWGRLTGMSTRRESCLCFISTCSVFMRVLLFACEEPSIENPQGIWVVQTVKRLTSAQVMISWFVGSSPVSDPVLTAWSLEPASDSVCISLSAPPPLMLCVSLSKINKHQKKKKSPSTSFIKNTKSLRSLFSNLVLSHEWKDMTSKEMKAGKTKVSWLRCESPLTFW